MAKMIDPKTGTPVGDLDTENPRRPARSDPPLSGRHDQPTGGQAPKPPEPTVNPGSVEALGRASLLDNPALGTLDDFVANELIGFRDLILGASGVDQGAFRDAMEKARQTLDAAQKDRNTKKQDRKPPPPADVPELPTPQRDAACESVFAANELALSDRRAVLAKPYICPSSFSGLGGSFAAGPWRVGQGLEYLHEWRHEGFTLGELVSSFSLLPTEEITLETSSWQRSQTQIEEQQDQTVKDLMEADQRRTDEETVANQAAAAEGWSVSASGSIGNPFYSASISASYSHSASTSSDEAEKHIRDANTKATHEVSQSRAVKMTQTAESGSESRTTRRIRNPNDCHTVTYNFFQIVKLYDVQLRFVNDPVILILPGLFPALYTDPANTPVQIPFQVIEDLNSPAHALLEWFDIDRDLSAQVHGWCLRVRMDPFQDAGTTLERLAEALAVMTHLFFGAGQGGVLVQPKDVSGTLGQVVAAYADHAITLRQRATASYGLDRGNTEQVTTPGVYVDAMLGRCSACDDYLETRRELDLILLNLERERREKRLEQGNLDPFEPSAVALPA